jgi:hypothetical protein
MRKDYQENGRLNILRRFGSEVLEIKKTVLILTKLDIQWALRYLNPRIIDYEWCNLLRLKLIKADFDLECTN